MTCRVELQVVALCFLGCVLLAHAIVMPPGSAAPGTTSKIFTMSSSYQSGALSEQFYLYF